MRLAAAHPSRKRHGNKCSKCYDNYFHDLIMNALLPENFNIIVRLSYTVDRSLFQGGLCFCPARLRIIVIGHAPSQFVLRPAS